MTREKAIQKRDIIVTQFINELGVTIETNTKPLIHCKDCYHYDKHETYSRCTYWSGDPYEQASVEDEDFCSYGERREP